MGAPGEGGPMSTSGTRAVTTLRVTMRGTGTGNASGSAVSGAESETRSGTVGVRGPGIGDGAPEAGRRRRGGARGREVRTRIASGSAAVAAAESGLAESGSAKRSLGVARAPSLRRRGTHPQTTALLGSPALMDLMPLRRRAGTGTGTDAVATGGRGSGGGTGIEIVSTSEGNGVKGGTRPPVAGAEAAAVAVRTTGSKGSGLTGGTSIWRPMLAKAIWLLRTAT